MFFTKGEVAKKATYTPAAESLKGDCEKCKAYKTTKHPKMQHAGQGKKKILIVGEFLTQDADQRSTHFGVQEQEMLLSAFERNDISLYRDCWLLNAHRCVPTEEPGKLSKYVKFCQKYLHAAVLELKPEYILLMGRWAITGFYHPHYAGSEGSYNPNRWRGLCIKDQKYNAVVSCTYSPFEIYMDAHDPAYHMLFSKDVDLFCEQIHNQEAQKIQKIDYEKYVSVLTDFPSVVSLLERILKNKINITFDYETTGLKPFSKGHKIALVGIALSETEGYCFPLQYKNTWTKEEGGKIISLWKEILKDKEIKKNNHNILFEDVWSAGILKTRLRGVEWDTQLAAHILDNRRMYTGLKFQTYIHFGVLSYDEHIHPYLVTNKESEFNNVEQAPFKDLSIYCALDCIFSLRLMNIQKELLWHPSRRKQYSAFLFYKKGLGVMSELQINGISSDLDYFQNMNNEVLQIVQELETELLTGEEARLFREQEKREMKLTAKDIGILLHKVLKYKGEQTDKGNWKVDKNALSNIKSAFTQKYTELQKYRKINNSFFSNYIYFTSGDKRIHGSFSINHVISYRSAANDPNMQNMSKRDKEAKNLLRTGFMPDPGSVLVEADFSGAEVNVSASTHGDKNFIRYLLDPTSDMHNDESCSVLKMEEYGFDYHHMQGEGKERLKRIRNMIKNKWVFAQFYGDWYKSCAKSIWEDIHKEDYVLPGGMALLDHLSSHGIYTLDDFTEHCEGAERALWDVRFPEYTQWKKDIYSFYLKHGYIDNYFGFRFQGYMNRKTCTNYPIQSVSFQLLVKVLIEVSKFLKKEKMKGKLVAQIHDSCVSTIPLNELDKFVNFFNETVQELDSKYKWMKVPMKAEFEISKPREEGGNFAKMHEIPEKFLGKSIILDEVYKVYK